MVYIHTCTIPRNVPLDNAAELLNNAKNGDTAITVSMARKAGGIVGKLAPKDIAFGPKNPAKRVKKIWDLPLEKQQQMLGEAINEVTAEYKAYEESLMAVIAGGLGAKEWVADNVKQGIQDLFDLVNTAEGCHNILNRRVKAMDIAMSATRKAHVALSRSNRGDVRRLLKPWETTKLPSVWRMQLHSHGLTRENIDIAIVDESAYTQYVPSQAAVSAAKPLLSDWSKPMWFADATLGVGARFIMVGFSFVMLFKDVVWQSCIGCRDVILSVCFCYELYSQETTTSSTRSPSPLAWKLSGRRASVSQRPLTRRRPSPRTWALSRLTPTSASA
jgi:hypothetical protein